MDHAQYLLLMGACLVITLPLEFVFGARVYRSPRRLLIALLPTFIIFTAWDLFGIHRDHWDYSAQFISGIYFGSIPLEELVFFIVIPICGLLTYEGVGKVLALARGRGRVTYTWRDGLSRVGPDSRGATAGNETSSASRAQEPGTSASAEPGTSASAEPGTSASTGPRAHTPRNHSEGGPHA